MGWTEIAATVVILLVIRPITGLIGLAGHRANRWEKLTLAFFGIRGVGSINYLASMASITSKSPLPTGCGGSSDW